MLNLREKGKDLTEKRLEGSSGKLVMFCFLIFALINWSQRCVCLAIIHRTIYLQFGHFSICYIPQLKKQQMKLVPFLKDRLFTNMSFQGLLTKTMSYRGHCVCFTTAKILMWSTWHQKHSSREQSLDFTQIQLESMFTRRKNKHRRKLSLQRAHVRLKTLELGPVVYWKAASRFQVLITSWSKDHLPKELLRYTMITGNLILQPNKTHTGKHTT